MGRVAEALASIGQAFTGAIDQFYKMKQFGWLETKNDPNNPDTLLDRKLKEAQIARYLALAGKGGSSGTAVDGELPTADDFGIQGKSITAQLARAKAKQEYEAKTKSTVLSNENRGKVLSGFVGDISQSALGQEAKLPTKRGSGQETLSNIQNLIDRGRAATVQAKDLGINKTIGQDPVLQEANSALVKGANPAAVKQRLIENGLDPNLLGL